MPYYPGFPFRFGAGACCCPGDVCWYFVDYFDRSISGTTDMGADWNEVVGDWGIIGYECVEKYGGGSTADAVIITTQQQPLTSAGEQYMSLDIYDPQTGDVFFLYPACTSSSSKGPLEAKYECLDSSTSPQTWRVAIGSETETQEIAPNEFGWVQAVCCVDHANGMAKAWMNWGVVAKVWDDSADPGSGRNSGFGHDNTSGAYGIICDNYFVGELRTAGGEICYDCFCRCREFTPNKELTLTIYDATGRYSCADGVSTTLEWRNDTTKQYWSNEAQVTGPNGVTITILFLLRCETGDPISHEGQNFVLSIDFVPGDCCALNVDYCAHGEATSLSTCVPFNLVFGPYRSTGPAGDLNCRLCYDPLQEPGITTGSFMIAITP